MRTRRKWILYGIFLAVLFLFALYQFFAYVLRDQWNERSAAEAVASSSAGLTEIDGAQKSVWDANSIYWVVSGKNKSGADTMVWVRFTEDGKPASGQNGVYAQEVSKGVSEKKMRQLIESSIPGVQIKRLLAGAYNGEYVWQLFCKEDDKYYYKFYRFSDGQQIGEGYALPSR
ncbi:DUF5590 domain-containing protein [Paenibacillus sp. HN-1]|uniref:cell wall elongation regulator TseB-like domain-containing protein n=1 Tax=Paenibacillus TaxID=44249 RepID=UPI001CA906B8|nr:MULTISPECIES: DUF5590 domain-containing protein [Paenibacillus]MBY9081689.1 DUF5590 domain-containing protein [Paenibacillus sp. CGMCC 1.18879]MBY9083558.1 DUF5590 domain-containing protein [Paenibacillus sinensis]